MSDLVSIITPAYNAANYIADMIESVLAQTYTEWELLITDDCSTDNTVDIVRSYAAQDTRIKLFRLEANSGAGVARNNSIREARGRYIAFATAMNLWKPCKLERQIAFMSEKGYKFVYTKSDVIDTAGNVIAINERVPRVSYRSTMIVNYIGTTTVMYDTEGIGKFYMQNVRKRQDWLLWIDIFEGYSLCVLPS